MDYHFKLLRSVVRGAIAVLSLLVVGDALKPFAGHSTGLSVALSLVVNAIVDLKVVAMLTLAGSTAAWATVERVLRRRTTRELTTRIKELEQKLDPSRSSSGLTADGRTAPGDHDL
jgi:hypothetical protein